MSKKSKKPITLEKLAKKSKKSADKVTIGDLTNHESSASSKEFKKRQRKMHEFEKARKRLSNDTDANAITDKKFAENRLEKKNIQAFKTINPLFVDMKKMDFYFYSNEIAQLGCGSYDSYRLAEIAAMNAFMWEHNLGYLQIDLSRKSEKEFKSGFAILIFFTEKGVKLNDYLYGVGIFPPLDDEGGAHYTSYNNAEANFVASVRFDFKMAKRYKAGF